MRGGRISDSSSSSSCETSSSPRKKLPGGRPVEAAQQVQERAFARTRGAHDRQVIPFGNVQAHAGQRMHFLAAEVVVLAQVLDLGGKFHKYE